MFRALKISDWKEFSKIENEIFPDDFMDEQAYKKKLGGDNFIGLFSESALVGYIYMTLMGTQGRLNRIGVKLSEQGKGYGTQLMEYVLDYFQNHNCHIADLYVISDNNPAIGLYKKYGFEVTNQSWHYIIDETQLALINEKKFDDDNCMVKELEKKDLSLISKNFETAPIGEVEERLTRDDYHNLALFVDDEIIIYGALSPDFSGMKPFICKNINYLEKFISLISTYIVKPYVRFTADDDHELAKFCEEQGYKLHHHLYIMTRNL